METGQWSRVATAETSSKPGESPVADAPGRRSAPTATEPGWHAELALRYERRQRRTVLAERHHKGPLQVQRPFYPEGGVCHTYVLHPPGGIVGGDTLQIGVECGAGSHALLTTPAATKFYRSAGPWAVQRNELRLEKDSILEWLPQETLYFEGAIAHNRTRVTMAPGSAFFGWEIQCLGRPAAGEAFRRGRVWQDWEILGPEGPLLIERARMAGGDPALTARWGLNDYPVVATLVAAPVQAGMSERVREVWDPPAEGDWAAVTEMEGVLVGRFLGRDTERAKARFIQAWHALRPLYAGRPACHPRIWNT